MLRQLLVHPKDKVDKLKNVGVVYSITFKTVMKPTSVKQVEPWELESPNINLIVTKMHVVGTLERLEKHRRVKSISQL